MNIYLLLIMLMTTVCDNRQCYNPAKPLHATIEFDTYDSVTYKCESGFEMINKPKRFCFQDGTWSGDVPKCVPNVGLFKPVISTNKQQPSYNVNDGNLTTYLNLKNDRRSYIHLDLLQLYNIHVIRFYGADVIKDLLVVDLFNLTQARVPCRITSSSDSEKYLEYICQNGNPTKNIYVQSDIIDTRDISIQEIQVLADEDISVSQCMDAKSTENMEKLVFNKMCYYIQNKITGSFETAKKSCFISDLNPPTINSRNVNKFLGTVLFRYPKKLNKYWIGIHSNISTSGSNYISWYYYDGTSVKSPFFRNNKVHATPTSLTCVAIDSVSEWLWNDFSCERNFYWICEKSPISCGSPDHKENSYVRGSIQVGNYIRYNCQSGHRLIGTQMRLCQNDGTWAGVAPTCKYVNCGLLENITNGEVTFPSGTNYGSLAKYFCKTGFEINGPSERICMINGLWNASEPQCLQKKYIISRCDLPEQILNGTYFFLNHSISQGSIVHYNCDHGYILIGNDIIECLSNGTWSGKAPFCKEINKARVEKTIKAAMGTLEGDFFIGLGIGLSILVLCLIGLLISICVFRKVQRRKKNISKSKNHNVDILDEDGNIYDTVTLNSENDFGSRENRNERQNSYIENEQHTCLQDNKLYENLSFPKTPIQKPPRKTSNIVSTRTSSSKTEDSPETLNLTTLTILSGEEEQDNSEQVIEEMIDQANTTAEEDTLHGNAENEHQNSINNLPDVALDANDSAHNSIQKKDNENPNVISNNDITSEV